MIARRIPNDTVRYPGVSAATFRRIVAAVGKYDPTLRLEDNELRIRRTLQNVSWDDYQRLLASTPTTSLPHTYSKGRLELSPRKTHDWRAELIARMIQQLVFELRMPIQSTGSTTISDPRADAGFEPDASFYFANEPKVRFKEEYEPGVDPPPDLVLEVDVTRSSKAKMKIFAQARVPEVWRIKGPQLTFFGLSDAGYQELVASRAFPFLSARDFSSFLELRRELEENEVVRRFLVHAVAKHRAYLRNIKRTRRKD